MQPERGALHRAHDRLALLQGEDGAPRKLKQKANVGPHVSTLALIE